MRKTYLCQGMAVMAMGIALAGCSKNAFDSSAQQGQKETEFTNNFEKSVMGGQAIDPQQTWATSSALAISLTPSHSGTLKIYVANPIGNRTAPLYTSAVTAGQPTAFSVSKPLNVQTLYAVVVDSQELILGQMAFDVTGSSVTVDMNVTPAESPSTRGARAARRAPSMPAQPTFSGKPAMATDYKNTLADAIAAGAAPASEGLSSGKTIYVTEAYYSGKDPYALDIQNYPLTIYFDGSVTFGGNNEQNTGTKYCVTEGSTLRLKSVRNGLTVYLARNATLDLTDISWATFQNSNSAIYMCTGSKLKAKTLEVKNYIKFLNDGGTVEAEKIIMGNNSELYNNGTITLSGDEAMIKLENTEGELVNNGTITGKALQTSGGGKMHNTANGVVTLTGATVINNEQDCWMNDGVYTSGTFKCTDTQKVWNNCRLTVTDKFTMGGSDSNFVLNGDASVVCDKFDWLSDNYFWLGSGSLVKVANTLYSTNGNWEKGFYNTTSGYAVISAKEVTRGWEGQWNMWYSGKIYVDTDSHFEEKWFNQSQGTIYTTSDVVFTTKQGTAPVSWSESKCRPAYNAGSVDPDPVMYYYYAFEDLGTTDDFDFNDVILRLSAPVNGKSTVQLVAAGGTLPAQVTYGTGSNPTNIGNEVHQEFDVDTKVMVNTGSGTVKDFVNLGTIDVAAGADMANLPFGITVTGNDGSTVKVTRSVANNGKAPLVIVVNGYATGTHAGKWFWAKERANIAAAYSQFGAWGASVSTNTSWYEYENRSDGSVYKY